MQPAVPTSPQRADMHSITTITLMVDGQPVGLFPRLGQDGFTLFEPLTLDDLFDPKSASPDLSKLNKIQTTQITIRERVATFRINPTRARTQLEVQFRVREHMEEIARQGGFSQDSVRIESYQDRVTSDMVYTLRWLAAEIAPAVWDWLIDHEEVELI